MHEEHDKNINVDKIPAGQCYLYCFTSSCRLKDNDSAVQTNHASRPQVRCPVAPPPTVRFRPRGTRAPRGLSCSMSRGFASARQKHLFPPRA